MSKIEEYTLDFVDLLEMVWGKGSLSPGGPDVVLDMLHGIELKGKKVLDFACGLGGQAITLASAKECKVVGVDIEALVIEEAIKRLTEELRNAVSFLVVDPEEKLPFRGESFDVVYSKDSILHIKDKKKLFYDFNSFLRTNGYLVLRDWFHQKSKYSLSMEDFLKIDGLTYNLCTLDKYKVWLEDAGFEIYEVVDLSQSILDQTKSDLDLFNGECRDKIIERYSEEYLGHTLESWELQKQVFESGEMQSYEIKCRKIDNKL